MGYEIYTNRFGYVECLGAEFKTAKTARAAMRRFVESDPGGVNLIYPLTYWVELDGEVVGRKAVVEKSPYKADQ